MWYNNKHPIERIYTAALYALGIILNIGKTTTNRYTQYKSKIRKTNPG